MPDINAATGALTIPIWAVGAITAVFVVLIMLAVAQAGAAMVINTMSRAAIVIAVACAGWIYIDHTNREDRVAIRRSLDERSAAMLTRAVAPGSALSCLNELAGEAVMAACEKTLFANPETVSAAVSYVTAELALLADGSEYARRVNPAYSAELEALRAALELDRFGIVGHVLARRGCTPEKCDALELFNDNTHVLASLRDHLFDDQVTKVAAAWNSPPSGATAASPDASSPAPPVRPAAVVSPQYDFPSADSIPPVNIMVPEPGTRNGAASGQGTSSTPRSAPIPPRRPQRTPVAAARPRPATPAPSSAAPVSIGEAPADTDGLRVPSTQ